MYDARDDPRRRAVRSVVEDIDFIMEDVCIDGFGRGLDRKKEWMQLRVLATAQATVINSRSSDCERTTFTLQGDVDDGTVIMLWLCGLGEGVSTVEEREREGSIDDRRSMGPLFRNKRRTGGEWEYAGGSE